jgi:hypothetical protein
LEVDEGADVEVGELGAVDDVEGTGVIDHSTDAGAGARGIDGRVVGAVGRFASVRAKDRPLRRAKSSCSSFVIQSSVIDVDSVIR